MAQAQNNSKKTTSVKIPSSAEKVIDHYTHLNINGKKVIAPYFMNEKKKKGRRVSVGKGRPEELEKETLRLARKYKFDLQSATPNDIRDFMIEHELGIDCSGFVVWVLNALVKEKLRKSIWNVLSYQTLSLPARLKRLLRPVENISVRVLTNDSNSIRIDDLKDIRVGDMIRIFNGHHILLITEIIYDTKGNPKEFTYLNSTMYKDNYYGVRKGHVKIKHIHKYLVEQEWIDGENGINWIYDEVKDFKDDSRIVRLKALI